MLDANKITTFRLMVFTLIASVFLYLITIPLYPLHILFLLFGPFFILYLFYTVKLIQKYKYSKRIYWYHHLSILVLSILFSMSFHNTIVAYSSHNDAPRGLFLDFHYVFCMFMGTALYSLIVIIRFIFNKFRKT